MLYWDMQTDNITYHMSEYTQKLLWCWIWVCSIHLCGEVQLLFQTPQILKFCQQTGV